MWSLDNLSTELLVLIFKKLRDIDARSLAAARQLSKRFDMIVTPLKFETLQLNKRIIDPQAGLHFPGILQYVYRHTRHVEVRSNLNPDDIKRVLDRIQRLLSLRWRFVRSNFQDGAPLVPSDILSPRHIQANRTRLYIENLSLRDFDGNLYDTCLHTIPTHCLFSLKMESPTPLLSKHLDSLKRLLLESRHMHTFHYDDRGQGTRFCLAGNERLPAFEDLALRSYDWDHSTDLVRKHWDFSRIRRLKLVDVPMFQFLTSVPFSELRGLHTLHYEDFSAHLPDRRQEATRHLYSLVRQIRALHTLRVTCHTNLFPVDGLLRHAASLRVLRFRDYVGFGDEERRCPTVSAGDLALLARHLVHLHTLELDLDAAVRDPADFARALCSFPRLDTLAFHTQTVLRPLDEVPAGADRDYEVAERTFAALVRGKKGTPAWRRITINVGGWRRVMVRRVSAAWREQNRRGVYAERCFVMERGALGRMVVKEEMTAEN
ncbi:F-box domain-containing protein [Xylariaceae sp. FL0662B]|nr:F-box domain-containing protein [Xylariaceae sp. FL0662B]